MGDDGIYIERFMYDEIRVVRPSAMDLRHISRTWKSGDLSRYFKTLRDLLLAGFCLLLMLTPSVAQEFVVTDRIDAEFVVTDREPVAAQKSGRYVAQFSIPSCGPCRDFEHNEKPTIEAAGYRVEKVDLSDADNARKYGQQITRFPTFIICDYETGEWLSDPIVGYTSAETLLQLLDPNPVASMPPYAVPNAIYSGKAGSSHQNRSSLINHLLNEGIHSGRHTSQQLNAMTDSELNYLHESDHGWIHSQPQPVVRVQQAGCLGGNCPSPTNRAQRRGGFLKGLFR